MLGQRAEAAAQALGLEYEMADAGHMVNDAAALLAGIVIAFTVWHPGCASSQSAAYNLVIFALERKPT